MQNEICVVKSFFHHVLVCEEKEVPLSTWTFGYTNAIPLVLSKCTFKVNRYYTINFENILKFTWNILLSVLWLLIQLLFYIFSNNIVQIYMTIQQYDNIFCLILKHHHVYLDRITCFNSNFLIYAKYYILSTELFSTISFQSH